MDRSLFFLSQQSEPSHSKYFSGSGEIIDPLPSSTANKTSHSSEDVSIVLIYLAVIHLHLHVAFPHSSSARQANVQPQQRQDDQPDKAEKGSAEACHPITISSSSFLTGELLEEGKAMLSSKLSNSKEVTEPHFDATGPKRRPRIPSSSGEDTDCQKTKRSRLGEPAASSNSNNPSSDVAVQTPFAVPGLRFHRLTKAGWPQVWEAYPSSPYPLAPLLVPDLSPEREGRGVSPEHPDYAGSRSPEGRNGIERERMSDATTMDVTVHTSTVILSVSGGCTRVHHTQSLHIVLPFSL